MNNTLLIAKGLVASSGVFCRNDILVHNGKIVKVAKNIKSFGAPELNCENLLVLPGIIDPHVHFQLNVSGTLHTCEDFESGSRAAVAGGVTTVIDYTQQSPGENLIKGIKERMRQAKNKMYTDYSFHCILPSPEKLKNAESQMAAAKKIGITSFKIFMAYKKRGLMAENAEILKLLEISRRLKVLICLHAESEEIISFLHEKYKTKKFSGATFLNFTHPEESEWEAVSRACAFAKIQKAPLYFVHLSCGKSAEIIKNLRSKKLIAETCPQYLVLSNDKLKGQTGHYFATCPPLRNRKNSLILWKMIGENIVRTIGTDNCTFTKSQKDNFNGKPETLPMGMPGCQTLLPLLYTFGVKKGKITLRKLVEIMCENPAKIMGLYPKKGVIREGSDADFAVVDPAKRQKVNYQNLQHKTDWSPYEGMVLSGFAKYTILRGRIIAKDGKIISKPVGKFIRRKNPIL